MSSVNKIPTREFIKNRSNHFSQGFVYWRNRWRSGVFRLAERILAGANISDRLGGDLSQIRHLPEISHQVLEFEKISQSEFTSEINIDGVTLAAASLPRSIGKLSDCSVDLESGLIRLDAGFILDAALHHWQQVVYQGGFIHEFKKLSQTKKSISGSFLVIPKAKFFYHFLLEDLPSIAWVLNHYRTCKVLIHETAPKWQKDVLNDLEIPYTVMGLRYVRVEVLVFITSPRSLTRTEVSQIKALRKYTNERDEPVKLFIKRGLKDRGDLWLESILINHFESKNFQIIDPDFYNFSEQRALFESASHIASLHGGALANLVWCAKGTKVLEIFNHPFRTYDYAKICAESNLDYFWTDLGNHSSNLDNTLGINLSRILPASFFQNNE